MDNAASANTSNLWQLLTASGLADEARCRQWQVEYRQAAVGAEANTPAAIAAWLVERKYVTAYQAKVLLAGKAGPFLYGPYLVTDRVKEASFAHCYAARYTPGDFPVWLQFVDAEVLAAPDRLAALESGVAVLTRIEHPSLHRWYEYQVVGPYRFLAMEVLEGRPLSKWLEKGKLRLQRACWIGQCVASALAALHAAGYVHGSIRPDQIWIASQRVCVLLHPLVPGLRGSSVDEATQADYWAPEYLQPGYQPQPLADVYALGCVLYAMLTGQPPFAGGTAAEKLRRHATQPIRPLETMGVPARLARLVTYLMAKNPAVRRQDLDEIARELGELSEGEADRAPPATMRPGRAQFMEYLAHRQATRVPASRPVEPWVGARTATGAGPVAAAGVWTGPPPLGSPQVPSVSAPLGTPAGWPPSGPMAAGGPVVSDPSTGGPMGAVPVYGPVVPAVPTAAVGGYPVANGAGPIATPSGPWVTASGGPVMTGVPVSVAPAAGPIVTAPVRITATRRRRRRAWPVWLAVLLLLGVSVGVVYWARERFLGSASTRASKQTGQADGAADATTGDGQPGTVADSVARSVSSGPPGSTPGSSSGSSASGSAGLLTHDDGTSLWASPTQGEPWSLALVPSEPLLVIALRPAQIAGSAEAQKVLKALGPEVEKLVADWPQQAAGMAWPEIEKLLVSVHEGPANVFYPALVIYPSAPVSGEELVQRWGSPAVKNAGGNQYYESGTWAYYFQADQENRVTRFVMGKSEQIQEVAQTNGNPPPFYTGVEPLLYNSDSSRLATIFFVSHYLRSKILMDGNSYYFGDARRLREIIDAFIGNYVKVGALSVHVTDSLSYIELSATTEAGEDKYAAVKYMLSQMEKWPTQSEEYIASLSGNTYATRFVLRFPKMLEFLKAHVRGQVENNMIILNVVLPPYALHNLAFGADMMLVSVPGATVQSVTVSSTPAADGPKSIEELLERKISLRFDQTSLEFAMRDVAAQVRDTYPGLPFEFDIVLLGMDMQKDGITKNQSIRDFNKENATVAEVLTALVMRGNPDTTVKTPDQPNQKLVWCIGDDPNQPGRRVVLITTRDGAASRNISLPPIFTKPQP